MAKKKVFDYGFTNDVGTISDVELDKKGNIKRIYNEREMPLLEED